MTAKLSIDELEKELARLTGHDLDCRCDVLSGSHIDWEYHTLCSLRRECKDERDRHASTLIKMSRLDARWEALRAYVSDGEPDRGHILAEMARMEREP